MLTNLSWIKSGTWIIKLISKLSKALIGSLPHPQECLSQISMNGFLITNGNEFSFNRSWQLHTGFILQTLALQQPSNLYLLYFSECSFSVCCNTFCTDSFSTAKNGFQTTKPSDTCIMFYMEFITHYQMTLIDLSTHHFCSLLPSIFCITVFMILL